MAKQNDGDETVTRKELAEAVYAAATIQRKDAADFVDQVIDEISDALARDGVVSINNFGVFTVRSKPERTGRNPKSGEAAVISPRKAVSFKPAAGLKRKVNGGNEEAAD